MRNRRAFKFEHRGCTLIAVVTHLDGKWHSHFNLAFPSDAKENMVRGDDGPFPSAEEAFEKAKG
jgi:hypothetical protein